MTSNLTFALSAGRSVTASKNDGTTFAWTPNTCTTNGECAMNTATTVIGGRYYYTQFAATAGTHTTSSVANTDAEGSICPQKWRLPPNFRISMQKSWELLAYTYGIPIDIQDTTTDSQMPNGNYLNIIESFPISLAQDSYTLGSVVSGRWPVGTNGGVPSSTNAGTSNGHAMHYYFGYNSSYVTFGPAVGYSGYVMRCVAL